MPRSWCYDAIPSEPVTGGAVAVPAKYETESAARRDVYVIAVENLTKDYSVGSHVVHALRRVSLRVRRGEFLAIMGPSGSGKSTFLNVLGCLDTPTSGRYLIDGEDVAGLEGNPLAQLRNKKIGFVFQTFNLLPRVSAMINVELPLLYARVPAEARRARARQCLEDVGLADRELHHPSQLSGGQQQRVAIARALANTPSVILADEPTGALDTRTSLEILALLQSLNRQRMTLVLVTHEADVAAHADRILTFRDGSIIGDERIRVPRDAAMALTQPEFLAVTGGEAEPRLRESGPVKHAAIDFTGLIETIVARTEVASRTIVARTEVASRRV